VIITSSLAGQDVNDSGEDDEVNTRQSRDTDAKSRAAGHAQSPVQLLGITTLFQNKERLSGLVLPPPAQNDRRMGSDVENVLDVKPNLNIQRPVGLLLPPPCQTDGRKRRASFDVENVLDAEPKRRCVGSLDSDTFVSDMMGLSA
jgi:hypothetical protein